MTICCEEVRRNSSLVSFRFCWSPYGVRLYQDKMKGRGRRKRDLKSRTGGPCGAVPVPLFRSMKRVPGVSTISTGPTLNPGGLPPLSPRLQRIKVSERCGLPRRGATGKADAGVAAALRKSETTCWEKAQRLSITFSWNVSCDIFGGFVASLRYETHARHLSRLSCCISRNNAWVIKEKHLTRWLKNSAVCRNILAVNNLFIAITYYLHFFCRRGENEKNDYTHIV